MEEVKDKATDTYDKTAAAVTPSDQKSTLQDVKDKLNTDGLKGEFQNLADKIKENAPLIITTVAAVALGVFTYQKYYKA